MSEGQASAIKIPVSASEPKFCNEIVRSVWLDLDEIFFRVLSQHDANA